MPDLQRSLIFLLRLLLKIPLLPFVHLGCCASLASHAGVEEAQGGRLSVEVPGMGVSGHLGMR